MLPDTINLHFTPYCNARCQCCFAKYSEVQSPCSTQSLKKIIDLIAQEPASDQLRRVNFVGGEPTIHKDLPSLLTHENSDLMLNSYAIIGPNGCFVDNASGKHLYSRPIEEVGIVEAWAEIRFDSESFVARRGLGGPIKEVAYV